MHMYLAYVCRVRLALLQAKANETQHGPCSEMLELQGGLKPTYPGNDPSDG